MVYVAQLAECLIVIQEVMGSTPIIHTQIVHNGQGLGVCNRTVGCVWLTRTIYTFVA